MRGSNIRRIKQRIFDSLTPNFQHFEFVKQQYLKRQFPDRYNTIPRKYRSHFVNIGGAFETAYIFRRWLPSPPSRVLIIGVYGGRDYFALKMHGYDVLALDLVPVSDFEDLIVGDVEYPLPLERGSIDAIIISEVLEHLIRDFDCLRFLGEVLCDEGVLIVSVPYFHDDPEYHIRIHSKNTIIRLLQSAGFQLNEYAERPGLFRFPTIFNKLHHFINYISLKLFDCTV